MWVARARFSDPIGLPNRLNTGIAKALEMITGRFVSYTIGIPLLYSRTAYMLDVGCGSGDWLIAMKSLGYFNLMGQDISGPAADRLSQFGIPAFVGDLRDFDHPSDSFDLVRMEHVLEHVSDPVGYFNKIRSLLKPGGRLVITIPSVESLSFQLAGCSWYALQPGYHLFFFTASSLAHLARRTGLLLVRCRYLPVLQQMTQSLREMGKVGIARLLSIGFVRLLAPPLYGVTMQLLRKGDFLTAEFVKT
ncbi:MAG: class I SAM-dependent methyltransferase [Candidatus Methanomethyliaceae archaeon]